MELAEQAEAKPVWRLAVLRPGVCNALLALVVAFGFVSHLRYLTHDCPIDLSGDEAHYWDWSRQLDWSYYSKGPLVAWVIHVSTYLLGTSMWTVRLPALVLAAGTTVLTYWLTLKLFRSHRLALGAVLLYHLVPVFVAGSVLMTIDPPFFFCWAVATCLLAKALYDDVKWPWVGIGVLVGVGFLAKYAMFLWFVSMGVVLVWEGGWRKWVRTGWPYLAMGIAVLFTAPVVYWNWRHGWVSVHHVSRQTGASGGGGIMIGSLGEFLLGQFAVVGPAMGVMMVGAVVFAIRGGWTRRAEKSFSRPAANYLVDEGGLRGAQFLVGVGLPFFLIVMADALRAKVQVNWPAPAYFSLMILTAWFLGTRLADKTLWKPWRPWFYGGAVFGIILMPLAHDMSVVYPAVRWVNARGWFAKEIEVNDFDPSAKLMGRKELGERVTGELKELRPGAFVLCDDYQVTAETAFYVEGRPITYCAGSYFKKLNERKRHSQYDLWPNRDLEPGKTALLGKDAVYVGYITRDIRHAFDSVEELPEQEVWRRGLRIKTFRLWRCRGFKGMERPAGEGTY